MNQKIEEAEAARDATEVALAAASSELSILRAAEEEHSALRAEAKAQKSQIADYRIGQKKAVATV